jgi:hypothetical protein
MFAVAELVVAEDPSVASLWPRSTPRASDSVVDFGNDQWNLRDVQAPAQVLVIVTDERDVQRALDKVRAGLERILPSGRSMDSWPLSPRDKLLPTVRGTGCGVGQDPRPTGILGRLCHR